MAKEWAVKFYHSKKWGVCRKAYIEKRIAIDGGMCEVCRERVGYIVHHKVKLTPQNIGDPNISLNHALLKFECKQCHDEEEEHFNDSKGQKRKSLICSFDENGQPVMDRRGIE